MTELEKKLQYKFKNITYLKVALTHSSYANEKKDRKSYERLEFLGDSILGAIVSEYIFSNCPDFPEGELTKLRASLVCEKSLCEFSKSLNIGEYLFLSHGEINSGGRERDSILADVFESITAAIYLDSNMNMAKKFVLRFIIPAINKPKEKFKDYKTTLQEIVQQNPKEHLEYVLVSEKGPDHNKRFIFNVLLNNNVIGKGEGHSKKEAEQQAAKQALELMGY